MELKNLQLRTNMFKDTLQEKSKMKLEFLLDSITLNDNRVRQSNRKPIKYVFGFI
jgi:hypothetical protein